MFGLWGRLPRGGYTIRALIRIGIFVAITAAFPFLLVNLIKVSGCRGVGGACGALALVVSIYAKPAIFLLFTLSLIGISAKRFRDAGYPAALGLLPALVFAGDWQFAMVFGSPWTVAFSLGVMNLKLPWFLFAGLAFVLLLAVLPSREDDGGGPQSVRLAVYFALLLAGALASLTLIRLWAAFSMIKELTPATVKIYLGVMYAPHGQWLGIAFCALSVLIAAHYLLMGGNSASSTPQDDGTPQPKSPPPGASPRRGEGAPRAAFGRRSM